MLLATHSLHFRVHTRVFVTLVVLLAVTTLALAAGTHRADAVIPEAATSVSVE